MEIKIVKSLFECFIDSVNKMEYNEITNGDLHAIFMNECWGNLDPNDKELLVAYSKTFIDDPECNVKYKEKGRKELQKIFNENSDMELIDDVSGEILYVILLKMISNTKE